MRLKTIQTWSLMVAAYRELNARKLFWLSIGLSGLVVASIGALGVNEEGISIFWWTLESPFFNSSVIADETFYKLLFTNLGVSWWLGLGATILALVSTAGIIPDLVGAGTIDMMVSKPISRSRLFLTKYATGLLFSALQVTVFTVACIIIIGIRGNSWEFGLLIAVPIVILFYSYLFCVCALVGLVTRSTVASLLLTMIFWFLVFGVQSGEQIIDMGRVASEMEVKAIERALETERALGSDAEPVEIERLEGELTAQMSDDATWKTVYAPVHAVSTILPKTGETLELLERWMDDVAAMPDRFGPDRNRDRGDEPGSDIFGGSARVSRRDLQTALAEERLSRSGWYVIGTSLLFEAAILTLACWIFRRRDF
ncbi:MAG: ABC transporter permease [Planctomycetota bacterium]|nr:ABC transporter permease [Planctomycetota bacterium]